MAEYYVPPEQRTALTPETMARLKALYTEAVPIVGHWDHQRLVNWVTEVRNALPALLDVQTQCRQCFGKGSWRVKDIRLSTGENHASGTVTCGRCGGTGKEPAETK